MVSVTAIIQLFLAFCGGISCLGAALAYVAKAIGWIRKPEHDQNDMLKDHETRIKELENITKKDYSEIEKLQLEMGMMLRAVMAIMSHSLDGNHTEELKASKKEINDYLTNTR